LPHCIIEYSKDLEKTVNPNDLMKYVHKGALNSKLFNAEDIKVRAIPFYYYLVGGINKSFIHITIRIFSGRNDEQCKKLSNLVLDELNKINLTNISLTVEIIDIAKEHYSCEIK